MTTTIIVDDTDGSITYSDGWKLAGASSLTSLEYNNTVHIGTTTGLELTFRFSGNRVRTYGTLVSPLSNGVATSTYIIDNSTLQPTVFNGGNLATIPDLQSHLLFFESPTLQEGPHTLTISISNITNGSPGYYLDFFTVDSSTSDGKSLVIVDDTSPSIAYTGNWTESHAFNEYLLSDHKASSTGNANATLQFNGTGISAFGSIATSNDPPTMIDFYIDSNNPVRYTAPPAGNILRNTLLFSQSGLTAGPHTLLIVAQPSSQWWLDYLIYSPTDVVSSSPPTSGGAGGSGNASPPIGAIVGGVVGGVALLSCLAAFFFIRRRRLRKQTEIMNAAAVAENQQFTPTTVDVTTPKEKSYPPITPSTATFVAAPQEQQDHRTSGTSSAVPLMAANARTKSPVRSGRGSQVAESQAADSHFEEPQREVDGGVRLASGDEDEDDIPPPAILPPSYARY